MCMFRHNIVAKIDYEKVLFLLFLCFLTSGCIWEMDVIEANGFYENVATRSYYFKYRKASAILCWFFILPPIAFANHEHYMVSLNSNEQEQQSVFTVER